MIGLLTFHYVCNYGAILQTYALQKKIDELNFESEYIDFRFNPEKSAGVENVFFRRVKQFSHPIKLLQGRKKAKKFSDFRKKYIKISKEQYCGDNQMKGCKKYNCYIVGSDQVWNFDITHQSKSYLLDFVPDNIPKSSYASSFGVSKLNDTQKSIFKELIDRFDYISVREQQGIEMLQEITNQQSTLCVDPTMLLSIKQWSELAEKPTFKNFIFVYAMTDTEELINTALKISRERNLKILAVGLKKRYKGIKNLYTVSPTQWIGLMKDSAVTITNSFHGTIFSILFNKEFYLQYLPAGWKVNSRLEYLVNNFGLKSRLITESGFSNELFDYTEINTIIETEQSKSSEFLYKICSLANAEDGGVEHG